MSVRFKYYLRGCGLGIVVAVVVMIAAIHSHGGLMTDDRAMERASELGMIMPENTEKETQATELPIKETTSPDTEKHSGQVTQKIPNTLQKSSESEKKDDADNKNKTSEIKGTEKESEKKESEKNNSEKQDSQKQDSEKTDVAKKNGTSTKKTDSDSEEETITFTIRGGEYCRKIAQNLYDKGLVEDAEEFRKYMQEHDYDNLIRVGTYQLKKGMDYKEIAKILTTRPN